MKKIEIRKNLGVIAEKAFLIFLFAIYTYLFATGNYERYISKSMHIFGIFSYICIVISIIIIPRNNRKIGKWILGFSFCIIMMLIANDGKLSDKALLAKSTRLGIGNVKKEKEKEEVQTEFPFETYNGEVAGEKNPNDEYPEYVKYVNRKNIVLDEKIDTWYINNRIMIAFKENPTKEELNKIIEEEEFKLVGEIKRDNQYYFETKEKTYEQLIDDIQRQYKRENILAADVCYPSIKMIDGVKNSSVYDDIISKKTEKINQEYLKDGVIQIDNSNFIDALNDIYQYPKAFEGKKIKIYGKTFKDSLLKENEFGIGLWDIVCCVLDMQLVGYIFETDKEVKVGSWYEIEGEVTNNEHIDQTGQKAQIPIIKNVTIKEIEEPKLELTRVKR